MSLSYRSVDVDSLGRLTQPCLRSDQRSCPLRCERGRIVKRGYLLGGQRRWCWPIVTVAALVCTASPSPLLAISLNAMHGALTLVDRTVTQDQGAWVVDYRLRHTGKTGVIITPAEIEIKVEGWVSNSRVPSHAVPRGQHFSSPTDTIFRLFLT